MPSKNKTQPYFRILNRWQTRIRIFKSQWNDWMSNTTKNKPKLLNLKNSCKRELMTFKLKMPELPKSKDSLKRYKMPMKNWDKICILQKSRSRNLSKITYSHLRSWHKRTKNLLKWNSRSIILLIQPHQNRSNYSNFKFKASKNKKLFTSSK